MDLLNHLRSFRRNNLLARLAAVRRGSHWRAPNFAATSSPSNETSNPLREFFRSREQGRGIFKWNHYFEIYHRHFSGFRNTAANVVEIGVFGGGSLDMWKQYFGPESTIYGVDIEPTCKAFERSGIKIFIGDQGDRNFWKAFRTKVPTVDIVIDDGSHLPGDQIATLEELFPYVSPGGIYVCEDVHGKANAFTSYVEGLVSGLNGYNLSYSEERERRMVCKASPVQQYIRSISLYPFVVVIEKSPAMVPELIAPMHGTEWKLRSA